MRKIASLLIVPLLGISLQLSAQTSSTPADNTKVNKRDQNSGQPTADKQKGRSDADITREIRRAITGDKAMSTYARNVKIVTQNGDVTLRGPVRSEEEKKNIEAKAAEVAGPTHVKNEIDIAAKEATGKK